MECHPVRTESSTANRSNSDFSWSTLKACFCEKSAQIVDGGFATRRRCEAGRRAVSARLCARVSLYRLLLGGAVSRLPHELGGSAVLSVAGSGGLQSARLQGEKRKSDGAVGLQNVSRRRLAASACVPALFVSGRIAGAIRQPELILRSHIRLVTAIGILVVIHLGWSVAVAGLFVVGTIL